MERSGRLRPSGGKGARQIGRISVLLSLNRLTTRHKLDWKLEDATGKNHRRFSASGNLLKGMRNEDNMWPGNRNFISFLADIFRLNSPRFFSFLLFFFSPFFYEPLARTLLESCCLRVVGKNCSKKKKVSHEIHGVLLILHRFERNIIKISQLSISRFLKKIFQISSLLNFSILWYHQIEMKIRNYREYQWIINYC